jgi:hypothetical protein
VTRLELAGPPWDWSDLAPSEVEEAWRELAIWVEQLRRDYRAWVTLPECWPLHEALRSELLYFMYWQKRVVHVGDDPEEGVRWHGELRRAAESWAKLATCDHTDATMPWPGVGEDQRRAVLARHLRQAVTDWQSRSRPPSRPPAR